MEKLKSNLNLGNKIGVYVLLAVLITFFIIAPIRHFVFDVYKLRLNGQIENIQYDIKEDMTITVSKKKYLILKNWPLFQKNVEVGDSVYKEEGKFDLILVKRNSKERIICNYKKE